MQPNKGNILIVDDTLESLQLLSSTLSEQGYKGQLSCISTLGQGTELLVKIPVNN
jgi:CheY-like chemotaxis protein